MRIVLRESVSRENVSTAWDSDWPVLRVIRGDKNHPTEVIYSTPDEETYIHYIEDFKLGLNYLVVVGRNPDLVVEEIRSLLPTYDKPEILDMVKTAKSRDEKMRALYYLALITAEQYDPDIYKIFVNGLADPDPEIRGATVLAIAYVGWPELLKSVKHTAMTDDDEIVRQDAALLSENMEKLLAITSGHEESQNQKGD